MFKIRQGGPEDLNTLLDFTLELAEYEKLAHKVVGTKEDFYHWIFERKTASFIVGELDGQPIATAIYFYNFSTFQGRSGIYLEDLYVKPEFRSRGYGRAMMRHLAQLAIDEGCGRFEWVCLDWNKPAIDVYEKMGATAMTDWLIFRMEEDEMKEFLRGD